MTGEDLGYAEKIVLGSCLIDRTVIPQVIELIPNQDIFLNKANQAVYRAIIQLYDNGKGIDTLTLTDQVKKNKDEKLATPYHIVTLTSQVTSTAHIETHCLILKEQYLRRRVKELFLDKVKGTDDDGNDILDTLSDLQRELNDLSTLTAKKQEKRIDAIVATFFEKTRDNTKIKLSFITDDLNAISGEMVVLAARPSMGKTALALQIAEYVADLGHGVGVLSLEMTDRQLVMRMVSKRTGIPFERLQEKNIFQDEEEKHYNSCIAIGELPLWIDDEAGITDLQIRAKCTRMKAKHDIGLIIIDYLQLAHSKQHSREQEISAISRTCKTIAKELNVPLIALSQLSRAVESRTDKRPLLSDLRESGAIEQDADQVWFLYRPEYYGVTETKEGESTDGLAELIVAKNRNGKLGTHKMRFNGSKFEFTKWDNFVKLESVTGSKKDDLPF